MSIKIESGRIECHNCSVVIELDGEPIDGKATVTFTHSDGGELKATEITLRSDAQIEIENIEEVG